KPPAGDSERAQKLPGSVRDRPFVIEPLARTALDLPGATPQQRTSPLLAVSGGRIDPPYPYRSCGVGIAGLGYLAIVGDLSCRAGFHGRGCLDCPEGDTPNRRSG